MDDAITIDVRAFDFGPPARPPHPLREELQAFDRLLPELLVTHRGQYVAVLNGRVVGSGADKIVVAKQAYAEHGYRPILVRLVTEQPRVVMIPSVRLAGRE